MSRDNTRELILWKVNVPEHLDYHNWNRSWDILVTLTLLGIDV